MARVGNGILAILLGCLAIYFCQGTNRQDLVREPDPQHGNMITVLVYGIGRVLLLAYDTLGAPVTACLLGLAALFFCYRAIRGGNQHA